jgi:octaheme c-type cytochrome (tetrathionate reductase family)
MPAPDVDLVKVAENVGYSSRQTCGDCHFSGGGGDAVKHADLSETLNWPNRQCDIHMGGYNFSCNECHKTRNHKIPGRSSSVAVVEGTRSCSDCHTEDPHYGNDLLDAHLNKHCDSIACNTCHSPVYSKCTPTKVYWDWSTAGNKKREVHKDKYGQPDYQWKKGSFEWKESAKPVYKWYNGYMKRILVGDKVKLDKVNNITYPVGSIKDPRAKISPFKVMKGIQPADSENGYLLIPHLFGEEGYWKTTDWQKSFKLGMKEVGLPYSGEYEWVRTDMYWGIHHEVMPEEYALSCAQCHKSLQEGRTCGRCHQDSREVDFKKLSTKGTNFKKMHEQGRDVQELIDTTDYIDFKALGYEGDPIIHGGRFKKLPLGYEECDKNKD